MKVIANFSRCNGEVKIPTSKSDLHRAIICASLAKGRSVIKNVTLSNDINATINAFKALGAKITQINNELIIEGINGYNEPKSDVINCDESGSTLRFIIPLLGLFDSKFTLAGEKTLFSRPLVIYEEIFNKQNLLFELKEDTLIVNGKIKENTFVLKGDISSQFISGLLFYLPLLKEKSLIKIVPPFESESYVNMTLRTLKKFGISIRRISRHEFEIEGNQEYKPCEYIVEGDYSQFALYAVLGAINNDVTCIGLDRNSIQGDRIILDILESFNVSYKVDGDKITIHKPPFIKGDLIDLKDCPDLGPICMVLSLFSITPVNIVNIKRLRFKESNRVEAMVENLKKLNAKIEVKENSIKIYPSLLKPTEETLNPYNDHRIMMSLVVLASKIEGITKIDNPNCVNKSYVNFYKDMQNLGIEVEINN